MVFTKIPKKNHTRLHHSQKSQGNLGGAASDGSICLILHGFKHVIGVERLFLGRANWWGAVLVTRDLREHKGRYMMHNQNYFPFSLKYAPTAATTPPRVRRVLVTWIDITLVYHNLSQFFCTISPHAPMTTSGMISRNTRC
jgi:hypothetical protein